MKNILLGSIVFMFILNACTKPQQVPPPVLNLLQHKWNWITGHDYFNNGTATVDSIHYFNLAAGDYIEFAPNNVAYIKVLGVLDTTTYNLLSDTKLQFDGDEFTINILNNNSLTFTYYERTTSPFYDQVNVLTR